jgi:VanZ family protein
MPGPGLVRAGLATLAAVAVIAVASEALQWIVPGRTPRLADVRDDLIGGLAGLALGLLLRAMLRAWRSR